MKKKIPHILALLLLMVWSISFTVAAQSTSSPENVTGVVISAIDKEPVDGVMICVKGTNKGVATDLEGRFNIDAQLGDTLSVKYIGCGEIDVAVDAQQLRISLCNFIPGWCDGDNLPRGVFGTVCSEDDNPLAGVTVTTLPSGKSTITDSKGYFNITKIEESDKSLRIEHPAYKTIQGRIDGNCFEICLEKNIVTGIVLDEDGEPVIGAHICAKGAKNGTASDFDGKFSICVTNGTILTVSYPGLKPQDIVADSRQPMTIVLQLQYDTISPKLKPKVKTIVPSDKRAQIGIQTYTVNGVNFKMVKVEGGTFLMGATASQGKDAYDDEKPAHEVTVSSFCIGQTEVTQELWIAVMGENPSWCNGKKHYSYYNDWVCGDIDYGTNLKRPVENVTWDDCQEFIRKLNKLTGKKFRLPTEAEWEFAACGGIYSEITVNWSK